MSIFPLLHSLNTRCLIIHMCNDVVVATFLLLLLVVVVIVVAVVVVVYLERHISPSIHLSIHLIQLVFT